MKGGAREKKRGRGVGGGPPRVVWESAASGRVEAAGVLLPFIASADERDLWVWMAGRTYRLPRGEAEAAPPAGVGTTAGGADTAREPGRAPARTTAREAGSPTSPIPGSVLRVAVRPGARVEPGSLLVVISAMKMEHEVRAEASGTVAGVRVKEGDRVEAGDVLVELTVDS